MSIRDFFLPVAIVESCGNTTTTINVENEVDEPDELDKSSCINIGKSVSGTFFHWLKYGDERNKKLLMVCSIC